MSETIETVTLADVPHIRARIVNDDYPTEPYDDGQSPILQIDDRDNRARCHVMQGSYTNHKRDSTIEYAWNHFQDARYSYLPLRVSPEDAFERYLRIFWGVTQVKTWEGYGSRGPKYLTYDPADWRKDVGLTDEYVTEHPETINMSEWVAYCEGDVYGIVIEQEIPITDLDGTDEDSDVWDGVDSLWGFYGDLDGYVIEEAKSMIRDSVTVR